ncbi:uncharacterized protein SAPINGB_P004717 [Magnusiomyces paraingens]|uniref:Uncharacterized protein n=1 Tax=Magnusiomyces paraingens TaxID=2606893 RepID=A0A5E8BW45_9ASCO|nr:uncharacterized protein SAPINGB_P004717 [Saprochaete ingens]VVT55746.1 unnamed protein product [Saprochaete ingens]
MPKHSKSRMLLSKSNLIRSKSKRIRSKEKIIRPNTHRARSKKSAKSIAELQKFISHLDIKKPIPIRINGSIHVFYNFGTKFDCANKSKKASGFASAIANVNKWDSLIGDLIEPPLKNAILAGTYAVITGGMASQDTSLYQQVSHNSSIRLSDHNYAIVRDPQNVNQGLKLALATKVTWYASGETDIKAPIFGFTLKYLHTAFHYNGKIRPEVSDAVQKFGQLLDTKIAMQILGVVPGNYKFPHISPTNEMEDRLLEFPVGAAYLSTAYEIFSYVSDTIYKDYIGENEIIKRIEKMVETNFTNRAAFHVSARSLGLLKRSVDLSQNDLIFISAVVHAIAPKSNLSRKKSIIPENQLKFNTDYLTLSKICRLLEAKGEVFDELTNKKNVYQKIRNLIYASDGPNSNIVQHNIPSTHDHISNPNRGIYNEEDDSDYVYEQESEDELEYDSNFGTEDEEMEEGRTRNNVVENNHGQVRREYSIGPRHAPQAGFIDDQKPISIKEEPEDISHAAVEVPSVQLSVQHEAQASFKIKSESQVASETIPEASFLNNIQSEIKEEFFNDSVNSSTNVPTRELLDDYMNDDDDDIILIKVETIDQV